ncbi:lipid A-modifier LpxR family protein [Salipiger sp. IMCC34102]|uniref:lipid A-modifier LpxR family protein n=1 Tax=Salipiger sp. IMCC34102 TaxID=2510647 RepID=UPI0013EB4E67|nr:lipid A-modifier LpxR family protein [Salipiger sp. IMCC34102]
MRLPVLILASFLLVPAVRAQDLVQPREVIGSGRLFNNDLLGDGHDRWRTGSFVYSQLRAPLPYDGTLPGFGDIIEYRLRSEIITPERATRGRPYVGLLSAGAHNHFSLGQAHARVGADVVFVGPQTGLDEFQKDYHDLFDLQPPVTTPQLDDATFLDLSAEVRQDFVLGPRTRVQPFAEARVGTEDLARVGADLVFGQVLQDDLSMRDVVTGQLYPAVREKTTTGVGLVFGVDVAAVSDSAFLPSSFGYEPTDVRRRARAGVTVQPNPFLSVFYGATYLSPEFESQPEGQVSGSLRIKFNF